jgi:hypothetical protein
MKFYTIVRSLANIHNQESYRLFPQFLILVMVVGQKNM